VREYAGSLGDQRYAGVRDRGIERALLAVDGARFGERVAGRGDAIDRPHEVYRRRPSGADAGDRVRARSLVGNGRMQQRNALRSEDADARRTAHRQGQDRRFDLIDVAGALVPRFVRQQPLIEVNDGVAVVADRF
jgi:hypothetical protein